MHMQPRDEQVQRHGIQPHWDDDIRFPLRRLHKLNVHWSNGAQVLIHHPRDGALPLADVPEETPNEARVRICIYKDLDIEKLHKRHVRENENPLHQNDGPRRGVDGRSRPAPSRMRRKVVGRNVHFLPRQQRLDVLVHEVRVQRVWVVEVLKSPLLGGKVAQVLVVVVVADERDVVRSQRLEYGGRQRGLATPRAAGDREHHRFGRHLVDVPGERLRHWRQLALRHPQPAVPQAAVAVLQQARALPRGSADGLRRRGQAAIGNGSFLERPGSTELPPLFIGDRNWALHAATWTLEISWRWRGAHRGLAASNIESVQIHEWPQRQLSAKSENSAFKAEFARDCCSRPTGNCPET
eukprot:scaffold1806_cov240-Pinguiococcus_pyrenoidosus.AAC.38